MDLLRAAILGIVQGLTEFLPVSSSGHLILVPALFRWPDQGLAFDVGLHVGTLLALLVYFWRDWATMLRAGAVDLVRHRHRFGDHRRESALLWYIAAGTVPAAVAGFLFTDWIEENVRHAWLVALTLAAVASAMLLAERQARGGRSMLQLRFADAAIIGLAQAVALVPGVSRSGATISAGLWRGLDRHDAARFAFLLGTPAFIGAAILKASDLSTLNGGDTVDLAVGFACSALVGVAAIHYLLRFLRTRTLVPFIVYRYAVAVATLVIAAIRVA